eukprot:m.479273 g.479273  ORF g.479273 m.479273 type:complete len:369 (-) comp21389_c0_seq1:118-1224(-)
MRALVLGATDGGDAAVSGHDEYGSQRVFQCSVEKRKALNVQHVHFVDKQYPWDDFGLALFSPLGNLCVDLVADLGLDLTRVTRKQRQKALRAAVDDVNLVQADGVHDFLALLKLALGSVNKFCSRPGCVVVTCARKRPPNHTNLPRCLVNCDHVPCHDFLLCERFNHFAAEVVNGFHFGCFEGELANLCAVTRSGTVDLHLNDLALDHFCFLLDAHANAAAKCLGERLGLAELVGKQLRPRQHGEGDILGHGLANALCHCRLARAGLAGNQDGPPSNLALLDHLHNDTSGAASSLLPDHALGHLARFKRIVKPQPTNVRLCSNTVHLCHIIPHRKVGRSRRSRSRHVDCVLCSRLGCVQWQDRCYWMM